MKLSYDRKANEFMMSELASPFHTSSAIYVRENQGNTIFHYTLTVAGTSMGAAVSLTDDELDALILGLQLAQRRGTKK